jgi:hypothetical protein
MVRTRARAFLLRPYRFRELFGALLVFILLFPSLEQSPLGFSVLMLLLIAVLSSAVYAVSEDRHLPRTATVLALAAVILTTIALLSGHIVAVAFAPVALAVFYGVIIVTLLGHVLRTERVTAEEIFAALSIYLLIGLLWGTLYTTILALRSDSFTILTASPGWLHWGDLTYFSFTTLTTVGLGDILPVGSLAKSLVVIESTLGMLYPAVLLARLVSLYTLKREDDSPRS